MSGTGDASASTIWATGLVKGWMTKLIEHGRLMAALEAMTIRLHPVVGNESRRHPPSG